MTATVAGRYLAARCLASRHLAARLASLGAAMVQEEAVGAARHLEALLAAAVVAMVTKQAVGPMFLAKLAAVGAAML